LRSDQRAQQPIRQVGVVGEQRADLEADPVWTDRAVAGEPPGPPDRQGRASRLRDPVLHEDAPVIREEPCVVGQQFRSGSAEGRDGRVAVHRRFSDDFMARQIAMPCPCPLNSGRTM